MVMAMGLSREEFLDGFTVDETTEIKQMSELELQRASTHLE